VKANLAVQRYYTDDSPYFARTGGAGVVPNRR